VREHRSARPAREPRAPRSDTARAQSHPRPERPHARADSRSERERAREDAYAKNPDQPPTKRVTHHDTKSALTAGGSAHRRPSHTKPRPVAALLMKRPKEPENV
jgi:hypothetical protein